MHSDQDKRKQIDADLDPDLHDANQDPITGEPGAHPVGTGIGAAAAGTIGTAIGAAAGPVGAVVGAVVGSFVGGLVGKGTAEALDPTGEDTYWRETYGTRPYAKPGVAYEDYQPAYRIGYEGYHRYGNEGRTYDEVEPDLRRSYETDHPSSSVGWDNAKHAVQDAWDRVRHSSMPNDEDEYWRHNYVSQPYYEPEVAYETYQPAYRVGYEGYNRYGTTGRTFDQVEPELRSDYERRSGVSLGWEKAKHAVRAAWERVENTLHRR